MRNESSSLSSLKKKFNNVVKNLTVEPLMFLYGLAFSITSVFVEDLQMRRICEVGLGENSSVCDDLKNFHNVSNEVQVKFSIFAFYDGVLKSAIPLFFILFMGSWSDKYGRKFPLYTAEFGHFLNYLGFLLITLAKTLPVEFMLIPTLLDSIGGGSVCFLTATNAYISDITSETSRTTRVGMANGMFFLGGPMGTFIGKYIYGFGGYTAVFSASFIISLISLTYIALRIEESHGPHASKRMKIKRRKPDSNFRNSIGRLYGIEMQKQETVEKNTITYLQMLKDFFNPQRIIESFMCTFKSRQGNARLLIMLVILSNLVRRLTRSPYVFAFSRHVLSWKASDYSLWVTYKNLVATVGTLVAVPLLSGHFKFSDYSLGFVGSFSGFLEYFLYGLTVFLGDYFFWIGPALALFVNSCTIAQRAVLSKFVTAEEIGKVSAVLGALDGVMPMVNFAIFMAVYRETVTSFPAAHFFLAASCSALMAFIFLLIMSLDRSHFYDIENTQEEAFKEFISFSSKSNLLRRNSRWYMIDSVSLSIMNSILENKKLRNNEHFSYKGSEHNQTSNAYTISVNIPHTATKIDSLNQEKYIANSPENTKTDNRNQAKHIANSLENTKTENRNQEKHNKLT